MSGNINMTSGRPFRLLISFALPLMLGSIFQQMYTIMDTAIIGQGVGITALAALGTVDWLSWLLVGLAQGFTQGFSVSMAQKYGSGDIDGLHHTIAMSGILSLGISVICVILSEALLPVFLSILNVSLDLYPMAELYVRIIFAGTPAVIFYNLCSSVLRSIGDSRTPLLAMTISAVTNITLDCLAVFLLKWGIAGAAGATVLSQMLSGVICFIKISHSSICKFNWNSIKLDLKSALNLLKLGAPNGFQNVIIAIGGIIVQRIVDQGDIAFIAGYTATNKLYGLLELAAINNGFAVATYVGQNYGAHNLGRIRQGVRTASIIAILISVTISVTMILFGRPVTMLFISTDSVAVANSAGDTAYLCLFIMCVFLPILYMLYVFRCAVQGMGDTFFPMISGIVEFIMRVGVAVFVAVSGYLNGIVCAEVAAWIGAAVFLAINYAIHIRKELRVNCKMNLNN